jgi:hypothetical protein
MGKPAPLLIQAALIRANVVAAELYQFLRRQAAQRTLRAAAVYDDFRVPGQIRAPHFAAYLVEGHTARAGDVFALELLIRQNVPEFDTTLVVEKVAQFLG